MVDIKFIAKASGVSIATVSRVLNGTKPVSPELRARVMEMVKKYNYIPNAIAQQMISKRTRLIGVILNDIANQFQATQLACMEEYALELGYRIIVISVYGEFEKLKKALAIMKERCVDTIIMMIYLYEEEQKVLADNLDIPVIFPNMKMKNAKNQRIYITVDEFQGAFDITEYLILKGHKRIGYFCSNLDYRRSGFLSALKKYGIPVNPKYMISEASEDLSLKRAISMLGEADFPTAWFCHHDMIAMRYMILLYQHGLRVPEDISLVGFDDIPFAGEIGLTTIRQPIRLKAKRQIDLALALADQELIEGYDSPVDYELIERTSVRSLNGN